MVKRKRVYACDSCGARHLKWQGQCPDCNAWNSLSESREELGRGRAAHFAGTASFTNLDQLQVNDAERFGSGLSELDRVLGGGLVPGSVVLIGGDPGIGKSTLLLSTIANIATAGHRCCYVTGEESLDQIGMRAERLGIGQAPVQLAAETCVESILAKVSGEPPKVLVIDSIQTLFSEVLESAPGSVTQLRESTAQLVRFAKEKGVATLLVGHVTKEGTLAGPRVLEHMVDTVLYFESDLGSRFRIIRAEKNRFGAVNELGFFSMTGDGFKEVKNPSAIFLAGRAEPVPGSITLVTRASTRSLLAEVQALVDDTQGAYPKRIAQGLDAQRLGLLLAVLHRHCGIAMGARDVFVNVVGGLRVGETAADLALALAIFSSFRERQPPSKLVVFGEIGLTGEVRPVPFGEERLVEAQKHGFRL
ncbi:MAG: DNA repair protein RadA, partial [Gammaproteobacteria bacterium]